MRYSRSKEWGVLRNIFLTEDLSDCVILVENEGRLEARFPCHRSVLITASKYFEIALPSSKFVEFIFEDIRPGVVMAFLEFIYFGWVALEGWEFMLELHEAAVEYSVPDLIDFCEASIIREIDSTNICSIFEYSMSSRSYNLMFYCRDHLRKIGFLDLNRKAFRECSAETVTDILRIFKEEEKSAMAVFNAVWEWCTYMCCRESLFLIEDAITTKIRPLFGFLNLQELSEEEFDSLPKTVVKKFGKAFPNLRLGKKKHDSASTGISPDWQEYMFFDEYTCDCAVYVKTLDSDFRFPCNKKYLSDASRVFAEMFQNMPKRKKNSLVIPKMHGSLPTVTLYNYISVVDISPSTMYTILMHIYINKVEFKGLKSVCATYVAAHRYKLIGLIPHCHEYMKRIMTPKNICTLLECAISTGSTEMLELCKAFICKNDISNIMNSRAFQEMSLVTLSIVVEFPWFNSRCDWLEFGVLWKQGIACCCESKTSVTRKNIWNEIRILSEYIDFNNLSDEEMQCIPRSERQKLRQQCPKSRNVRIQLASTEVSLSSCGSNEQGSETADVALSEVSLSSSESNVWENGRVCGLQLPEHAKIFQAISRCSTEIILRGNFILFQFSLSKNAFLPTFSIFHLGNPMFSALKSVRICKRNEAIALYRREKDDDLKATQIDCPEETEIVFRAVKDLYIEANEVHTVEVNYGDSRGNLVWELVWLLNDRDGELEVTIRSEKCYGLRFLSFLPDLGHSF